jgi:aerobic-type carbon monoxide dehydrogenase small subunit (CoxS/CutS family)
MAEPDDDPPGRVSRRTFLKTAGVGAAATSLRTGFPLESPPAVLGPGPEAVSLKVNGVLRTARVEPRVTLLRALRNSLEITGAKEVCNRGGCGACTVLVDGKPVYSCMLLAVDAQGHEITTVEGLGTPEKMSPVQAAFVEQDALQCGFCTPGFVVACTAFLASHPDPTTDAMKEGLAGNLCRCGTYSRIFEAVQKAAHEQRKA